MNQNTVFLTFGVAMLALSLLAGCQRVGADDPRPDWNRVTEIREGTEVAATAETAPTATGWGTLKGRFVWNGPAPQLEPLSTGGKDVQACGTAAPNETIVIGQDNGLQNVVIFARRVSRVHPSAEELRQQPVEIDQKSCVFTQHVAGVLTGQPLRLLNSDPVGHNVKIDPSGDEGMNRTIPGGGEDRYAFNVPQTSPVMVQCSIHPWMAAYLLPRRDPYFAVTGEDGSFEIANLPAGEKIEFQVWHERSPDGLVAKSDWNRGRFSITLANDGDVIDLGTVSITPDMLK